MHIKAAREILQSHFGEPILETKVSEETRPVCVQVEDDDEGGLGLLLWLVQTTTVNKQLSARTYLEIIDQRKLGSVSKGLESHKSIENDQLPKTAEKCVAS